MPENDEHRPNVEPDHIPLLSWASVEDQQESINQLYESVQKNYISVINWYLTRKSGKRAAAQWLRRIAIILSTLAALGMVITAIHAGKEWAEITGAGASALLVLAAGFVAFDRFFGFSSSWIRFILTSLRLQEELKNFQIDMNKLASNENEGFDKVLEKNLQRVQQAYDFLYSQLQIEANQWADEFRGHLNRSMSELAQEIGAGAKPKS